MAITRPSSETTDAKASGRTDTTRRSGVAPTSPGTTTEQPTTKRPLDSSASSQRPPHENETLPEAIESTVTGHDQPMEREHPKAPGALIWFTYPLVLMVLLAVAVVAFMLLR
jgi:hypothetical protein